MELVSDGLLSGVDESVVGVVDGEVVDSTASVAGLFSGFASGGVISTVVSAGSRLMSGVLRLSDGLVELAGRPVLPVWGLP